MFSRKLKKAIIGSPLEPFVRSLLDWKTRVTSKYDREALQVMGRILKPNSNCIDVGCHRGLILRQMLRRAPQGRHFAFEPVPDQFGKLLEKFPNAKIFNVALSDTHGECTF